MIERHDAATDLTNMKKKKRKRKGTCVYCGKIGPVTDDHIPPSGLFPKSYPHKLITVPSCDDCNKGASKDDEYFRLSLTVVEDSKGHAGRDAVFPSVLRSLSKPEAKGFSDASWNDIRVVERFSPMEISLGPGQLHYASVERMDKVVVRIMKGLVFIESGKRLPDDCVVRPIHFSRVAGMETEGHRVVDEFAEALESAASKRVGDVFAYSMLVSPKGWPHSAWLLEFYGREEYLCMIGPADPEQW